jgi:hypothetical protein
MSRSLSMMPQIRLRKSSLAIVLIAGLLPVCKQATGPRLANGDAKLSGVPPLSVSPASTANTYNADFGQVAVGQHLDAALELSNDGSAPLTVVAVGAPTDAEFNLTLALGTTVQAGSQVAVPVSFKPFSAGQKMASVTIQTDSTTTPTLTINLTGTGVNLKLLVTPKIVDFGIVVVHSQKSLQVTLTNQSTLDLTVTPQPMQGNNAALFTTDTNNVFSLAANGSQTITVTYSPLVPSNGAEDTASFVLASNAGDNVTVYLQGIAAQSGLTISPNPLDFNFVQPGASLTKTLKILNIGNRIITVSGASITNPGTPQAAFSAVPASGMLSPGQELDLAVTFQPAVLGQFIGELDVISNDNLGQTNVTLTGWGGGAAITCAPTAINFSTVGAGYITTSPVICTNSGSDVIVGGVLDPRAELVFDPKHPLLTSSSVFTAAFNPPATSVSLKARESVRIDVGFDPAGTEQDQGTLTVVTNVTNPPAPPIIALSGAGLTEQKCYYTLSPGALNWGEVTPKVPFVDGFTITNTGPNECLVSGLDLTLGTDPAYALVNGPVVSQRLSPPGTSTYPNSLTIPVRFDAPQNGTYTGGVGFTITDPAAPHQVVSLTGVGGNACLVLKPNPLDFPVVGLSNGQYCQNSKLKFNIVNTCTQDAIVKSLTFAGSNTPFQIIDSTPVPFTVPVGGTSPPVLVGFKPIASGTFYGSIQVASSVLPAPLVEIMNGKAENGSSQTDQFVEHKPAADILWVLDTDDDWGFWSGAGNNFLPELQNFMTAAAGVDYQMGVTTVEVCAQGDQGNIEPCPTCHNTSFNGSGDAMIFTPNMSDPGPQLQTLVNGINMDPCVPCQDCVNCCQPGAPDEHFLAAAQLALDANSNAATHNQGFLRPNAFLSLILVNGDVEDDYSPDTWQSYVQFFQNLKVDPSLFNVNYIISDPAAFVSAYPNLKAMVKETGGVLVDTNNDKWAQPMAALWATVLASSTIFPLSGLADPASIQVFVDGPPPNQVANGQTPGVPLLRTNPNGSYNWKYDPTANTVFINALTVPLNNGDSLFIEYTLVCG